MTRTVSLLLLLGLIFSSCSSKKDKKAEAEKKAAATGVESSDQDFHAFVGRLRKAIEARDMQTLAQMMTPDFAYVMGSTPEQDRKGEGVFQDRDEHGLWPELEGIVSEKFVKKDDYYVAPPQFANPAVVYDGYRVGIRRMGGSWKFVYFVNG